MADVTELTAFQRDLLFVVAGLNGSKGAELKRELEETQGRSILSSRVYTNLDDLVRHGLVEKRKHNGRSNVYTVTEEGERELQTLLEWQVNYFLTTDAPLRKREAQQASQ